MFSCKTWRKGCLRSTRQMAKCLPAKREQDHAESCKARNERACLEHFGTHLINWLPKSAKCPPISGNKQRQSPAKWKEIRRKVHLRPSVYSHVIRCYQVSNWMQLIYSDVCAPAHHRSINITCPSAKDMESVKSVGCPKIWVNDTCPSLCTPFPDTLIYPEGNHQLTQCPCLLCLQALWVPWLCTGIKNHAHPGEFCLNLNILQLPALLRRDFLKKDSDPNFPQLGILRKTGCRLGRLPVRFLWTAWFPSNLKILFRGDSLQPDPATKVVVEPPKTSTLLISRFKTPPTAHAFKYWNSEYRSQAQAPKPEYRNAPTQSRAPLHVRQHWSVELWLSWIGPKKLLPPNLQTTRISPQSCSWD